jgi:arylsulfatase
LLYFLPVFAEPMNVLLVSIDTLRADHMSCYGYPRETTPVLKQFSEQAVMFEDCLSPMGFTLPSHTSMLTGLNVQSHQVIDNGLRVPAAHSLLPEMLSAQGWETAAFIGCYTLHEEFQINQGFDSFAYFGDLEKMGRGGITTDAVIDWLNNREEVKPFFGFVHYYDVHEKYGAPGDYGTMFCTPDTTPEPVDHRDFAKIINDQWSQFGAYRSPQSASLIYNLIGKYDGGIAYVDNQIGRILKTLGTLDLEENTIVIITSDHGEGLGDGKHVFSHGKTVYQFELHVPLMMRIPGITTKRQLSNAPVATIDITPTILDVLDIQPSVAAFDGLSLKPLIANDDPVAANGFRTRERYAQSGAKYDAKNIDRSLVREGNKFILSQQTAGHCVWGMNLNAPLNGATRLGAYIKSEFAPQAMFQLNSGETNTLVHALPPYGEKSYDFKRSHAGRVWALARNQAKEGWVLVTTPPLGSVVGDSLDLSTATVKAFVLNLGMATTFEGMIDSLVVERNGTWQVLESFEGSEEPQLRYLGWAGKNVVRFEVIEHQLMKGMGRNESTTEYLSLIFPDHAMGKQLYDLNRDPWEKINIRAQQVPRAKEMEESLRDHSKTEAKTKAAIEIEVIEDSQVQQELEALGYF